MSVCSLTIAEEHSPAKRFSRPLPSLQTPRSTRLPAYLVFYTLSSPPEPVAVSAVECQLADARNAGRHFRPASDDDAYSTV